MSGPALQRIRTLGLFEQRFDGGDSLMKLACRRFLQARMGAEMHAGTSEHLSWLMGFRPWPDAPVVVHLPRDFDLLHSDTRDQITKLAPGCAGQVYGLVLHDQEAIQTHKPQYLEAVREINARLEQNRLSPFLFIEYAIGLDPDRFAELFSVVVDCARIAPCIDIGHVGIRAARAFYAKRHRGDEICHLKSQPAHLPKLMHEIGAAVRFGASVVFDLIKVLVALGKPIHFHLHDGHPLSNFSRFGVSDHLSFFAEIPLSFEYQGRCSVPTMFGPVGLGQVVSMALAAPQPRDVSFTLEIHPMGERLALDDAQDLFKHWKDQTHAEQMNHWLSVLSQNHALLTKQIQSLGKDACRLNSNVASKEMIKTNAG